MPSIKLVFVPTDRDLTSEAQQIQGIVRIGSVRQQGGFLVGSMLETAPFNRRGFPQRRYSGVGRVLAARLVVESYRQGGRGKIEVRATRPAQGFYTAIGLTQFTASDRFLLDEDAVATLLNRSIIDPW